MAIQLLLQEQVQQGGDGGHGTVARPGDDHGHDVGLQFPHYIETGLARHLDIQEHQVRAEAVQRNKFPFFIFSIFLKNQRN